jgi:hypothetical protein
MSRLEAAIVLGDDPNAPDPMLNVGRRIDDGRLGSYCRSIVEKRRAFKKRVTGATMTRLIGRSNFAPSHLNEPDMISKG